MISVTGANGYVGTHLVQALAAGGEPVVSIVRPRAAVEELELLQTFGARIRRVEIAEGSALRAALEGTETVFNLVGSIQPHTGVSMYETHVLTTRALINAARASGVKKIIHLSSVGTKKGANNSYHYTKWLAEEIIRESGMPYTILRSSLIFGRLAGRRDSKLISRLSDLIRKGARIPLLGDGKSLVQPIFIEDVVHCLVTCLRRDDLLGKCYELGGPKMLTFEKLVDALAQFLQCRIHKIRIPYPVAIVLASLRDLATRSHGSHVNQIKILRSNVTCDIGPMRGLFQIEPTDFELGLRMSLP